MTNSSSTWQPTGDYLLDWDLTGADGSAALSSASGDPTVSVTVSTPANGAGQEFTLANGLLESADNVTTSDITEIAFGTEVTDVNFRLEDVDARWSDFDDKITVLAYDSDGNLVDVNFSDVNAGQTVSGNSIEGGWHADEYEESTDDDVSVSIAGPIVKLVIVHENGSEHAESGVVRITDMGFNAVHDPADLLDGIVQNGDEGALIDESYTGDPHGDMVDHGDAILPGEVDNDDIIYAMGGDDTVLAGEGDDEVYAGAGDDYVDGGADDDVIYGDSETRDGPAYEIGDLIVNGSFEDHTGMTQTEYGYVGDGGAPGWQVSTPDGEVDFHNDGRGGVAPTDGNFWMDLEQSPGNISIYQDVENVVAGESYTLSFDAADSVDHDDNGFSVYWNGQLIDTIDPAAGTMQSYSYTVIGGSGDGSDRLTFVGNGNGDDNIGASIDSVKLVGPIEGSQNDPDAGNDTLLGGDGDDVIYGEGGNDTIIGGEGQDTLYGGDDRDTFIGGNDGDVVDGGDGGDDWDTLDLSGSGPARYQDGSVTDDPDGNSISGTIEFLDGDGNVTGTMDFREIEEVIFANQDPDAVDDSATVEPDGSVTIPVLANDSDPNGDPLNVIGVGTPEHGTATLNPDGTVSYMPEPGFTGQDSFTYTISDGNGGQDTASVCVNVETGNQAPDAVDDAIATDEGDPVDIPLLANDSDPDGDTLIIIGGEDPANGSVTDNGDGTVTYTPNPGFTGTDTFTYTISDGNGGRDTATVTVEVRPDAGPNTVDAVDDAYDIDEDTTLIVDLTANDSDPEGDDFEVISVGTPGHGSATLLPDGTVKYVPDGDYYGTDTFTYTVRDEHGATDTATVTLNIAAVSDDPDAEDDIRVIDQNTPVDIDVLANDSDPDGDTLAVRDYGQPTHGTVTEGPGGTLTYTPDTDYTGTDTFTYTVTDGTGGTDTATVTVQVGAVYTNSVDAVDDTATTTEGDAVAIAVLSNDSDPEGDSFSVSGFTDGANGTVSANSAGVLTYTPDAGFVGTDSFTYTIVDENGATDTATVTVTVTDGAENSVIANDDALDIDEDSSIIVDVTANDSDPEGDDFSVTGVGPASNGTTTLMPDGTVRYTPNKDFYGTDSFSYTVTDENGATDTATVTVNVDPVNDAPDAEDDVRVIEEDTPVSIDVLANDSDPEGDPLSVVDVTDPGNGTVTQEPDGTLTYTPNPDFTGTDSFTYTVSDGNGGTDTATVTVVVEPDRVNTVEAADDTGATAQNTALTIDVLANDTDPEGDAFAVTGHTDPANGSVTDNGDGTFTYTPNAGFIGSDSFTYTIEDATGATDTATVTVQVTAGGVNAVDAVDDAVSTDEDSAILIDVTANDSDPDGDAFRVTGVGTPSHGTVELLPSGLVKYTPDPDYNGTDSFSYTVTDEHGATDTATVTVTVDPVNEVDAKNDTGATDADTPVTIDVLSNDSDPEGDAFTVTGHTDPANGSVTDNGDGTFTYTPEAGFTGTDTFSYTVTDEHGATDQASVTVTVGPAGPNTVDAVDDVYDIDEDTTLIVDLRANDSDPEGDDFEVTDLGSPSHGTVTLLADGTVKYVPAADYHGTDSFSYTVTDENGATDTATVTINVTSVNDAPDAEDDVRVVEEGTPVTLDPTVNDSDADGDPLEIIDLGTPTNGTVTENPDGTVTYTPEAGFTGTDTFSYTISDGNGATDTATVTVVVQPDDGVNSVDAVDDTATTTEGDAVEIDVLSNDSDPEGDAFTVTGHTDPANGSVTDNGDGTFTYTPEAGFTGTDTFTYTVTDEHGATDTATVTVTVTDDSGDTPPVATDDSAKTPINTPVVLPVLLNDSDPDGDDSLLEVIDASSPDGTATINADGTITFTPATDFTGYASITYTIEDEDGLTDTATVTVLVNDGIVEGTEGDDLIDGSYTGDPEGDMVDAGDNIFSDDPAKADDDIIEGYGGDDTIIGGAGDDHIDGGDGDDKIYGGDGDDTIIGGAGSDYVEGGDGDDVIDTSAPDEASDYGFLPGETVDGWPLGTEPHDFWPVDTDPNNDRDVVYGGAGDDTISTGDDADVIFGEDGDDTIDGGLDDDAIYGGDGDDTIIGGHGSDLIHGGAGDDVIYGGLGPNTPDFLDLEDKDYGIDDHGDEDTNDPVDDGPLYLDPRPSNGMDVIYGGDGNDTIYAQDDDDVVYGGAGDDFIDGGIDNDVLFGGEGDDEIHGGAGNDYIDGGEGEDKLYGGDDRDYFINVNPGDFVDGGEGGDDWDTLNLTGSAPKDGWLKVTKDPTNVENGTVEFFDKDGNSTGTMSFINIEDIVPCFTPGTLIATPKGEVPVEELQEGDRIITRDNGIQEIRWIGSKSLDWKALNRSQHLRPILIRAGSLGNGLPERDMMVSPNHRMLVANDRTALYFDEREVLASAKHLVDNRGIQAVDAREVTYIHFLFDHHEVVLSDGTWSESFQPGDYSLKGIGNAQRQELFELFPELETREGLEDFTAARRILKKHEAKMLRRLG